MTAESRRVALLVAYDGADFHGFQQQAGDLRTVQGVLETALSGLVEHPVRVHGAGRTDAGVHALGQVVHVDLRGGVPTDRLLPAVNGMLPDDAAVRGIAEVPEDFHARYQAVEKRYVYRIYHHPVASPFLRRYALHEPRQPDRKAMTAAARELEGERDFASFQAAGRPSRSTVRRLRRLHVVARPGSWGDETWVVAVADGFLYKMVRNLVGTLLDVGRGRLEPREVAAITAARDRRQAPPTAPARGLWLAQVHYERDLFDGACQASAGGEDRVRRQNLDVGPPFT